jgi:hypothetical protein
MTRRCVPLACLAALVLGAGCGGASDVDAPPWVLDLARQEAASENEESPHIAFATCGPATCIVRMHGDFRCDDCSRPPGFDDPTGSKLELEIDVGGRHVVTRSLSSGD